MVSVDWVGCAFAIVVVAGVEAGTCSVLLLPWLWIFDSSKEHISCVAVCFSRELSAGSMWGGLLVYTKNSKNQQENADLRFEILFGRKCHIK